MYDEVFWRVSFEIIADGEKVVFADLSPETKDIILGQIRKGWLVGIVPEDTDPDEQAYFCFGNASMPSPKQ